jgi:hypothetical protein
MKAKLVTVGTFRFLTWKAVLTEGGKTITEFRAKTCDKVQKYHDKDGEPVFGIQYWVKKNEKSCLNAVLAFAIGKGLCTDAQTKDASCVTLKDVEIAEKATGFKSEVDSSVLLGLLNPPPAPAPETDELEFEDDYEEGDENDENDELPEIETPAPAPAPAPAPEKAPRTNVRRKK